MGVELTTLRLRARRANHCATPPLLLHPKKTLALYISPSSRKSSPLLTLTLDNEVIQTAKYVKYLGILIDDQLSFKSHITYLENKIARSVGVIAKLSYFIFLKIL